jgi:glycosyltransferase involved in cell wall biosynthesis
LATRGYSALIAQTPFPGRVSSETKLIIRYHDAVPVLMPHTISDSSFHQSSHYHALKENVRSGAWFSCISEATRRDLLSIFPEAEARSVVIHNVVSEAYYPEPCDASVVGEILNTRRRRGAVGLQADGRPFEPFDGVRPVRYLLMVSTLEPRKNHELLVEAWERLRVATCPGLKLVLVGSTGWDFAPLLKRISPWIDRGEIFWLSDVPAGELRSLYVNALATICPGYSEGFDYSGIEAMKCGCCVAASDIDVHREIYEEAALYFNPYDVDATVAVISRLIGSGADEERTFLASAGSEVSGRYGFDVVLPKWQALFAKALSPAEFRARSDEP